MFNTIARSTTALIAAAMASNAQADAAALDLAKSLSNPVAALISVPFQYNYDHHIGPDNDGERHTLNIQPVIPISISEDWNLISRTILPLVQYCNTLN